ncbi:hypothetical protein EVAR_8249_1 [Eumeta japonica]|uniref:Uncharacterized protein n=1 Tax=Eumeta variegata TaxID=151549 RepID=A0A4C1TIW6_EUMVA|nr:hypothetical protein EVAR_8249_1 [Eumeta japonica]
MLGQLKAPQTRNTRCTRSDAGDACRFGDSIAPCAAGGDISRRTRDQNEFLRLLYRLILLSILIAIEVIFLDIANSGSFVGSSSCSTFDFNCALDTDLNPPLGINGMLEIMVWAGDSGTRFDARFSSIENLRCDLRYVVSWAIKN